MKKLICKPDDPVVRSKVCHVSAFLFSKSSSIKFRYTFYSSWQIMQQTYNEQWNLDLFIQQNYFSPTIPSTTFEEMYKVLCVTELCHNPIYVHHIDWWSTSFKQFENFCLCLRTLWFGLYWSVSQSVCMSVCLLTSSCISSTVLASYYLTNAKYNFLIYFMCMPAGRHFLGDTKNIDSVTLPLWPKITLVWGMKLHKHILLKQSGIDCIQ